MGIKRQGISEIKAGRAALRTEHIKKLWEEYKASPHYLVTGEGNMFMEEHQLVGQYISLTTNKLPIPISQQFIFPMLGDTNTGYIVGHNEHETYMESFNLPLQKGQNIRGFVVQGDSMYPMLNNGDIVFCKRVLDFSTHKFLFKDAYVIVCNLGVCIKHIIQTADGLRLVSDNSQHKDIEVGIDEVYEVWRVEGKYIGL